MKRSAQINSGFTLIELLITITIIVILGVTVFVALNPAQRLKDAKDARRTSDVDTILSAIHASIVDDKGNYPSNMPAAGTIAQLGTSTTACTLAGTGNCVTGVACVDLIAGTENLTPYLKSMPIDPTGGTTFTAAKTGYTVVRDTNGIVTVTACGTEGAVVISASR